MLCVYGVYVLQQDCVMSDCRKAFFAAWRNMFITGTYLVWTGTYIVWTKNWLHALYCFKTCTVHTFYCLVQPYLSCVCTNTKQYQKNFIIAGIKLCTSCTLLGCSDSDCCTTSVNTLVCYLYLRQYKSSNLLKKSHLVSGVKRPVPALHHHPLQPCQARRRAGPPLGQCSGFRLSSQAWLGSTAWILLCGDVQPPNWEIGSGWRVQVGQCSSSSSHGGHVPVCHSQTVGPGRLARIWVGQWELNLSKKRKLKKPPVVSPGRGRRPWATVLSSHAVAGQGSHLDFVVAQLGFDSEARLGSCNVVMYSHPIEK
jgi:hypothetical protein